MKQNLLVSIVLVVVLSSGAAASVPFTLHNPCHDTWSVFTEQNSPMSCSSSGWPQIFDGGSEDASMGGVAIDSQGNILVSGYSVDIAANESNILTLKYDSDGNQLWQTTFDSSEFELPWDIAVDSQDNIIVMGLNATSITDFEELKIDFRIIKCNKDGVEQWNTSHRKALNGFPGGVAVSYGLLNFIKNDDELGIVLGHELIHLIKGHILKSQGIDLALAALVLAIGKNVDISQAGDLGRVLGSASSASFSRDFEREADFLGTLLAYKSDFDINKGIDIWERFAIEIPKSLDNNFLSGKLKMELNHKEFQFLAITKLTR